MKIERFVRTVGGTIVVAALVAGCTGSLPANAPRTTERAVPAGSKTFHYTGKEQSFTVPSGVTQINVTASGAGSPSGYDYHGGRGGLLKATIDVNPGEKLAIFVGGAGVASTGGSGGSGGFNGGGAGGRGTYGTGNYIDGGSGGGGASDVRQGGDELTNRIIVAPGGGGAGGGRYYNYGGAGGIGGGKIGGRGARGDVIRQYDPEGGGGRGGTQRAGGAGGYGGQTSSYERALRGHRGMLGNGGAGGCCNNYSSAGGGGGGGGYYGGGGGGAGAFESSGPGGGGGGGGGSSWVEPSATNVNDVRGGASLGDG